MQIAKNTLFNSWKICSCSRIIIFKQNKKIGYRTYLVYKIYENLDMFIKFFWR